MPTLENDQKAGAHAPSYVLRDYFEGKTAVLSALYEHTKGLRASVNKGSLREWFCREFLSESLPPSLTVDTGEIWSSDGSQAGQIDILVVYDYCPRLTYTGGPHVCLVEGVFAAIEVKSFLNKGELRKAINKLDRLRSMGQGHRFARVSGFKDPVDRPIRCVFAYDGPSAPRLSANLRELDGRGIVDIMCVLSRGVFVSRAVRSHEAPDDYECFDDPANGLAALYFHLCHHAAQQAATVGAFDLRPYFRGEA